MFFSLASFIATGGSWKGYDLFVTGPGEREEIACNVCGAPCRVSRDEFGPTGVIDAMGGLSRPHDRFRCPHSGTLWHARALALTIAKDETPSDELKKLIQRDIDRELAERREP